MKDDDSLSFSDKINADNLNDFFVSISAIDDYNTSLSPVVNKTNKRLDSFSITEQDITDVLSNLVIYKASGPDEICHRMLKETRFTVCEPLKILFSMSVDVPS